MPLYSETASLHILLAELRVEVYVRRTGLLNMSVLSTLVLATALPGFAGLIAHSSLVTLQPTTEARRPLPC